MTKLKGTSMEYGGPSHTALKYATMKRSTGFSVENLLEVFPKKFSKPSKAVGALLSLERHGFVYLRGNTWKITSIGVTFLRANAQKFVGEFS